VRRRKVEKAWDRRVEGGGGGGGMHKSECHVLRFGPLLRLGFCSRAPLFTLFFPQIFLYFLEMVFVSFHGTRHLCILSERLGHQCITNQWGLERHQCQHLVLQLYKTI
jgi:hypothetical protein